MENSLRGCSFLATCLGQKNNCFLKALFSIAKKLEKSSLNSETRSKLCNILLLGVYRRRRKCSPVNNAHYQQLEKQGARYATCLTAGKNILERL